MMPVKPLPANALRVVKISFLVLLVPYAANAYGPEGMFGGRASPDSTYVIYTPVDTGISPERGQSVLTHARPDYDPQPIAASSFYLYPSLEFGASYDSNIYARPNNVQSDEVYNARPALMAVSNWNRNALSLVTFGDFNVYGDNSSQNYNNAYAQAQGRIDILKETWIGLRAGYQRLVTGRGSPNDVNGLEPTSFNVYSAGASAYRGAGMIKAKVDYDFRHLDYSDTTAPLGSLIPTSNESRDENNIKAKVGYELTANFKPYVQVDVNRRDYDNDTMRNSRGYQADIGVDADMGGIILLNAYAGWLDQNYYNFSADQRNDAFDFGGRAEWNVTGLTTLVAEVSRSVEEDPFSTYNSFLATGGSLTLTHELRRNILIEADASYTHDEFQGAGSQTQDYPSGGGGVRWLINQNFYTDFVYNYQERTSDDYQRNIFSLRLNMHL